MTENPKREERTRLFREKNARRKEARRRGGIALVRNNRAMGRLLAARLWNKGSKPEE